MQRIGAVLCSPLAVTLLLACGDDDAPTATYSDWAEEQRTQVDAVCDCYEEFVPAGSARSVAA